MKFSISNTAATEMEQFLLYSRNTIYSHRMVISFSPNIHIHGVCKILMSDATKLNVVSLSLIGMKS